MKEESIKCYREIIKEAIKEISKENIDKIVFVSRLKKENKMPIKIVTEKCIVDGKRCRGIVSCEGFLAKNKLPNEYLVSDLPAFYCNDCFGIKQVTNEKFSNTFLLRCKDFSSLLEAKVYPENEFQQIISYIRKAGENLKRINQKLKLERWKGREEFII